MVMRTVNTKKEQSRHTNVVVLFTLAMSLQQTQVQLEATISGFCFFTVEVLLKAKKQWLDVKPNIESLLVRSPWIASRPTSQTQDLNWNS
ncbi:hypothetical protein MTR_3g030010 [Medicago truncatula]|uniref:Uncharacterized protein n=1 Tax=Medicago truncatula TaxID=3880 RepID=G7IWN1_MEDTR|nr:hypothetical protein MTR_3g030010 [Medicago truncatula]